MISNELREFVDHVLDIRQICDEQVCSLSRTILPDGAISHEVIDVLVSLDRAIRTPNANWAEFLVATTVEYVVWTSRPTGLVGRDMAHWLITTLSVGDGPTGNAMRIAFEVVREAERCDESLISFAMGRGSLKARQDLSRSEISLLAS